ncbi:MAG: hypothetical protein A2W11_02840 [Ignavibacteria bacterium RBG_16_35_7]|nr:MAG: hypothetical protein A2W11_02840 [Ignavibacteria bacterium RBG_16_35_7]
MKSLMIFLLVAIISTASYSQYQYTKTLLDSDVVVSDPIKVPLGYFFSGIQITTDLASGQDSCFFLVTADTKFAYDTLKYDGAIYWVKFLTDNEAVTLDIKKTWPWPWFKVVFDKVYSGSVRYYFYPTFTKL